MAKSNAIAKDGGGKGKDASILTLLRRFIRNRDYLVSRIWKKLTPQEKEKLRMEKVGVLEKVILGWERVDEFLTEEKERVVYEKLCSDLFQLVNVFSSAAEKVVAHYIKVITYSSVELVEVKKDLESEAYVGVIKGLLKIKRNFVVGEHVDITKIESYIMKVARTYLKDVIPNHILIAYIPRTCWGKMKEGKSKFAPIYLHDLENNNELQADSSEENSLENISYDSLILDFDCASVEFRDFVRRLPEPFRSAVVCKLEGISTNLPPSMLNLLVREALEIYRKL